MLKSLFNKMQAYRPGNLLKRHSTIGVFLTVIAKFLRTTILKNICERLLLRVFAFMLVRAFPYMNKYDNYFCARALFSTKLQGACNFIKKRDWYGVFWWIFRNFWEHVLYRTQPGDCFLRRRFPQKQSKKTILKLR